LEAGWLWNMISMDTETESCKHLETVSVTMELNTFPTQRTCKQWEQNPLIKGFLYSSWKVIKGDQMRLRDRLGFVLEKRTRFVPEKN
jgi:hypothetical protein